MNATVFALRNSAKRLFGLVLTHRVRRLLPRRSRQIDRDIYIYPTWQCNLKCKYCQNLSATGQFNPPDANVLTATRWADALNRIGRDICISGGDPFLYPQLAELVNNIDRRLKVTLYTNLSAPGVRNVVEQFKRPVHFYASYHPCSGPPERMIQTAKELAALGKFDGRVHAVGAKKTLNFLWKNAQEKFRRAGLQLDIIVDWNDVDFPGSRKIKKETIYCSKRAINIGPDGKRYNCVTKAIRAQDPICDVGDARVTEFISDYLCHDYGFCCACDMAEPGYIPRKIESRVVV